MLQLWLMNLMVSAFYDAFCPNIIVPLKEYTDDASQSYLQYITKEFGGRSC